MKTTIQIRFARPDDMEGIIDMCEAHANHEQSVYSRKGKKAKLRKDFFGDVKKLHCLVAESNDGLVGYAIYMRQYASWSASDYIYIYGLPFLKGAC